MLDTVSAVAFIPSVAISDRATAGARLSVLGRGGQGPGDAAAADPAIRTSSEPSAWPVIDCLNIERNKTQSRQMAFSGTQHFASSCSDPETPEGAGGSAWLFCWIHIKLVHVNRREIELVFVGSLMKPLLVALNSSL